MHNFEKQSYPLDAKASPIKISPFMEDEISSKHELTLEEYKFFSFTPNVSTETGVVEKYIPKEIKEIKVKVQEKPKTELEIAASGIIREAEQTARRIVENAEEMASATLIDARKDAEIIKNEAYQEGHIRGLEDGTKQGQQKAYFEHDSAMEQQRQNYLEQVQNSMEKFQQEKDELMAKYLDDLRDMTISIAEKVVNVSLKSSGEIIEKMILTATEKIRGKQWAKINISQHDAEIMQQADIDILESVKYLSDQIKLVIMNDSDPGSCIIELPDQIIDASASTQFENIKEMLQKE